VFSCSLRKTVSLASASALVVDALLMEAYCCCMERASVTAAIEFLSRALGNLTSNLMNRFPNTKERLWKGIPSPEAVMVESGSII
jgi:hypothetical protein